MNVRRRRVDTLAEYGRVSREALMKGGGYTAKQLEKPFIGVANSFGDLSPGSVNLNNIADRVKQGIRDAGGTPVEFRISSTCVSMPHGGDNYRWTMPWRDITASYIEAVTEINYFDALVYVTVCDDAIPAHTMAAVRTGLPAIIIPGGSMGAADYQGQPMDWPEMMHKFGELKAGRITKKEFGDIHDCAICGAGNCGGAATGNTGAMFAEALGLALPGAGSVPGRGQAILDVGYESGKQIMQLWEQGITTREVVTKESFENAVRLFLSIGGSTNSLLHIMAIGFEAGLDIDLDMFDRLSRDTPHLTNIAPAGKYNTSDLYHAGGVHAVLKELAPKLHTNVMTATGKTLAQNLNDAKNANDEIIKTLDAPVHEEGGIAIIRGNLAPNGAVVKQAAVPKTMMRFKGKAKVFDNEVKATTALVDGGIVAGDVVVINFQGPVGDPGMRQTGTILANLLVGMDLIDKVALVTDGRTSGTCEGLLVLHAAPEAAVAGPLGVVQDGDEIEIDVPGRSINLLVDDAEVAQRLETFEAPQLRKTGFLSVYQRLVTQADKGAVLDVSRLDELERKG